MKLCVKWVCEFQIIEIDHFMRYGKNRWWPFTFPNVSFPPSCMKNISWEGIPSIESPMIEFCSMYYLLQYIRIPCKLSLHIFISYTIEWIEFLDGDVCTKCIVVGQSYNLSQNRNWKDTIEIFLYKIFHLLFNIMLCKQIWWSFCHPDIFYRNVVMTS